MFYIKVILIGIWLFICCISGLFKSVLRWGDPDLGMEFGRMYSKMALKISGIEIEVEGKEYLEEKKPCIYIANHQSNFDMAVFGTVYPPKTVVIGKKELIFIPFFGLFYLASGNIIINRGKTQKAKEILSSVVEEIKKRGVSVWIFPEGTRNKTGEGLLPFKKGSFYMAVGAQVPIIPVLSSSTLTVADWKNGKIKGGKVKVKILPPVMTEGLNENDIPQLSDNIREIMLKTLTELN